MSHSHDTARLAESFYDADTRRKAGDAPLSDDDYLHYCNDVGPLLPRIAIIPIGHIVNSVAYHLQPEAFEQGNR